MMTRSTVWVGFFLVLAVATLAAGCARKGDPVKPVVAHFTAQNMTVEPFNPGDLAVGSDPVPPMMNKLSAYQMGKRLRDSPSIFDRFVGKVIRLSGIETVESYVVGGVPVSIFAARDEISAQTLCGDVSAYNVMAEQQIKNMRRMEAEMSSMMALYGMSSPYALEGYMQLFARAHCRSKGNVGVVVHYSLAEREGKSFRLRNKNGGSISLGVSRVLDAFDRYQPVAR